MNLTVSNYAREILEMPIEAVKKVGFSRPGTLKTTGYKLRDENLFKDVLQNNHQHFMSASKLTGDDFKPFQGLAPHDELHLQETEKEFLDHILLNTLYKHSSDNIGWIPQDRPYGAPPHQDRFGDIRINVYNKTPVKGGILNLMDLIRYNQHAPELWGKDHKLYFRRDNHSRFFSREVPAMTPDTPHTIVFNNRYNAHHVPPVMIEVPGAKPDDTKQLIKVANSDSWDKLSPTIRQTIHRKFLIGQSNVEIYDKQF